MKSLITLLSMCITLGYAQPKEGVEFKLNTISGIILDSLSSEPLMDVDVDIFTGNGVLKHSTITDENGFYTKNIVGYLWKPKIRFSMHNYKTKKFSLNPKHLDKKNNMTVNSYILPVPENQRIPDLTKSTITKRAETFFIVGNIFYNLIDKNNAERIIISSAKAIEPRDGFILMKINDLHYDVARCYVPQEGKYENLSYILKSLLNEPIFEKSGNPIYLSENYLDPSIIYGKVINISNGMPVMGAEVILTDPFKRRISDENGQYAFQVDKPGNYELTINPPPYYKKTNVSIPTILMKYGKGGWYKSNFYVRP